MTQQRVRIAVQKSGKLSKDSLSLFKKCGLTIVEGKNQLLCKVPELPIDILLVRDDDIPSFVHEGVCDMGIIGENVLQETLLSNAKMKDIETLLPLGFSTCRLSLAVPKSSTYSGVKDLQGKKIATSYGGILGEFLRRQGITAEIIPMEGAVEVAPHLEIADLICDIVSSGATLEANGLAEREVLLQSQAVCIGRPTSLSPEKQAIVTLLLQRMQGVISAGKSKYIMFNAPKSKVEALTAIISGAESPSIVPLANADIVAVHAVCQEEVFWQTMEKLKQAGASSILVLPIEKMLP